MKNLSIFLALIVLLAVIVGCTKSEKDNDIGESSVDQGLTETIGKTFSNLDEFKSYINDKENQSEKCPMDDGVYVDFSSILPTSEIAEIRLISHNYYSVDYNENIIHAISVTFMTTPTIETYNYDIDEMIEGGRLNETPIKSMSELKYFKPSTAFTQMKIEDYDLCYQYDKNDYKFCSLIVFINNYIIDISWNYELTTDDLDAYTPEQAALLSAIVPEYGATDDSVIAMLDRIKALIPTGDEASRAQVNASTDASFEFDSGSTFDQTADEPFYVGEAGETGDAVDYEDDYVYEDTEDYEDEEYLYPEDYEFPVIPGISPDWKPNANGKYPLKDGYTRYEITLILACEILLDFEGMTEEEISRVDIICIEEDEEAEE